MRNGFTVVIRRLLKVAHLDRLMQRSSRRKLIYAMRGYRILKDKNQLARIYAVLGPLINTPLRIDSRQTSKLFFGENVADTELVIRQYLYTRTAGIELNKSLLATYSKPGFAVRHPMPAEWRKIIRNEGYRVSGHKSRYLWNRFIVKMLLYGVAKTAQHNLRNFKSMLRRSHWNHGRYVYFDSLVGNNLPQPCRDGRSFDIITWYQQWEGRILEIDTLCHGVAGSAPRRAGTVPVVWLPTVIPPLSDIKSVLQYFFWGIAACTVAIFDFVRGRWWHALLLREASLAKLARLQLPEKLARDYLFHNSDHTYRPLWTYDAEKKGSRIALYFYSTNNEGFKNQDGYRKLHVGWHTATWPVYLVWDQYQVDYIARNVDMKPHVQVVGPIWFSTSADDIPELPADSYAVFDVQPVRDSYYQVLGFPYAYYTPDNAIPFLGDITTVLTKQQATIVLKRKRNIGKKVHAKYEHCIQKLENRPNFIRINPDTSAVCLIEKCKAVISMPFTSTALLGRALGKPSIYYDPCGFALKEDRAAHGIPIVSGIEELEEWIAGLSHETKQSTEELTNE